MARPIIKPRFPASDQTPQGHWKYLASTAFGESELKGSCVKEGRVVAISSPTTVRVLCDGKYHDNVPVAIHTDIGARTSYYREANGGAAIERDAADYYENSAFIFTVPGCVPGENYLEISNYNDLGNGEVDFDVDDFTFSTEAGNWLNAAIIDSFSGSLAVINQVFVDIDEDDVVTVAGTILTEGEYRRSNNVISIFVDSFMGPTGPSIPVECILSLAAGKISICKRLLGVILTPPGYTEINQVRIATEITQSPRVLVVITGSGDTRSAKAVIQVLSNRTENGTESQGPFKTYKLYVSMEVHEERRSGGGSPSGYVVGNTYLYDVLEGGLAVIPSRDASDKPALPFFEAGDIITPGLTPYHDTFTAFYGANLAEEEAKSEALGAFLDRGFTVYSSLPDLTIVKWGDSPAYHSTFGTPVLATPYCRPDGILEQEDAVYPGWELVGTDTYVYHCFGSTWKNPSGGYDSWSYKSLANSTISHVHGDGVFLITPHRIWGHLYPLPPIYANLGYATSFRVVYLNGMAVEMDSSAVATQTVSGIGGTTTTKYRTVIDGEITELQKSYSGHMPHTDPELSILSDVYVDHAIINIGTFISNQTLLGFLVEKQLTTLGEDLNWGMDVSAYFAGVTQFSDNSYIQTDFEDFIVGVLQEMRDRVRDLTLNTTYGSILERGLSFEVYLIPHDIEAALLND